MADIATRRVHWERATAMPFTALAVAFLVSYVWQVLDHGRTPALDGWLTRVDIVIWVLFSADFLLRLRISTDRRRFLRHNWLDLSIVVVPPLRPLRLLRAALLIIDAVDRHTRFQARMRLAVFVGVSSVLLVLLCSVAVFDAERDAPGANIHTLGEAAWWSVVSVTTVGYGDFHPVTVTGRLVAVVLMTVGIGLISFTIGAVTSWVIDKLRIVDESVERADRDLEELVDEVRCLRAELAQLRAELLHTTPEGVCELGKSR
ncbi:potassium channel family protein [Nocardia sp. CDC160]|uniref:potassium channel family protein n=1 Tax=Nocardia sp. CDC160 TaxID=3112166 RepID=UPI002DBE0011|nr:ion channel [Nocardia sp. CDC160]MEC3919829.1 ion channel [Nocardia sp. CDC160]